MFQEFPPSSQPNPANQVNQSRQPLHLRMPFLGQQVGLGDAIHGLTDALGIPQCKPCEERQRRANQAVQFMPWNT